MFNIVAIHSVEKISDQKLYELCKTFGGRALMWRQKFIGLLPEVNRRRLFERHGFGSIFEFAAKLAGVSAEQVRVILNLEKRFEDKPTLKALLENGEVSINKLARVASVVTPESEDFWAGQAKLLPRRALDTLVRDERHAVAESKNADGLQKPTFDGKSLAGQTLSFSIADDVKAELDELYSKGIDVNELLREMLERRRAKIAEKKEEIGEEIVKTMRQATSRYIPAKIKKILKQEFGEKCSIATCQKPAEETHHAQRFGLSKNHDPRFLAPLCKNHHIIAHSIDVKFHETRTAAASRGEAGNQCPAICSPASRPVAQEACKLNPPVKPSISKSSPAK